MSRILKINNHFKTWEFELGSRYQILVTAEITFDIVGHEYADGFYPGYPGNAEITSINAIKFVSDGIERNRKDQPEYFQWIDFYLWSKYLDCEKFLNDLQESIQWTD